ncbi:MAG: ATP-binding protein [Armatimonadota bacterium]|nr:ATP-binding protein [Armatimonadota bacterium]
MSTARKILIADDSAVVVAMLKNILKGGGYDVVTARDGIEATQRVYSEYPDLILLDIFMPRMNGYQVCRLLKNDPSVAHIPVIILTAADSGSAQFWSLHTGANAFMVKGFAPEELLATVAEYLPAEPGHRPEPAIYMPGPEEILSKVTALMDQELYTTTVQRIELKTILQSLSDGVLTLDINRTVTSVNPCLCKMLGLAEGEILGRPCQDVLGEQAGADTLQLVAEALSGQERGERDSEIHSRDGIATPVAISVAALRDYLNKTIGCVCLFQDITKRKQIEALNQLKNDLTDMIVHDLRTPLTSLLTGLQTVELLGDLNEDQQEFLGISIGGGHVLLGMINDLLDISKMEDGSLRLEYKELQVSGLIDSALRQVLSLAEAKNLTLTAEIAPDIPPVFADEDKLRRTLVNLLSNSIKFTPAEGRVTVVVQSPDGGSNLVVSVRDTGEGIPREAFERIFEKFGQVDTRKSGRKMSTGLGLTFCKMAVVAHGGRIWVESTLGEGSTFSFAIPTKAA